LGKAMVFELEESLVAFGSRLVAVAREVALAADRLRQCIRTKAMQELRSQNTSSYQPPILFVVVLNN